MRDPLLFGDFRNACNEDEPRFYEDLLDYEAVYTLFMEVSKLHQPRKSEKSLAIFFFYKYKLFII